MEYIFVFTFSIVLVNTITAITYLGNRVLLFPRYKIINPHHWALYYPSLLYQVYFWAKYLCII